MSEPHQLNTSTQLMDPRYMPTPVRSSPPFTAAEQVFFSKVLLLNLAKNHKSNPPDQRHNAHVGFMTQLFFMTVDGHELNTNAICDYTGIHRITLTKLFQELEPLNLLDRRSVKNSLGRGHTLFYEFTPSFIDRVHLLKRQASAKKKA